MARRFGGDIKYVNLLILFAVPAVMSCFTNNRMIKFALGIVGEIPSIVFAVFYVCFYVEFFTSVWADILIIVSAVVIVAVSFALTFALAKKDKSNLFFLVLGIIALVVGCCGVDVVQNIFHTFSFAALFTGLGFIYAFISSSIAMIFKTCFKSK